MGEFLAEAAEALKAAEALCGPVALTEISDRRGSAVWKASGPAGAASIKLGTGEAAEVTAREASVLDRLPGYEVAVGRIDGGVWYVTRWEEGPSTWHQFRSVRAGRDATRSEALASAVQAAQAVADLHGLGWIHGDLQPAHAIHTPNGVRLIDFAWARQLGETPWTSFRGTMVHLTAPELAAEITAGGQPVLTTFRSDVYALAAALWTCVTGDWPLDYEAAGIDRQSIGPAALLEAIGERTVPLAGTEVWPELQQVLKPVLLGDAKDRPLATELADQLTALHEAGH
ncbi:protein kinase domain-containing protein [Kitasatospora cineracea]|uniref:protein kinase domain-containing protein n=1 Tax=Kitasatospora cineracea TaxID=88074 RepID=UPI0037BE0CFB